MKYFILILTAAVTLLISAQAKNFNNNTCGIYPPKPLTNAYGPFDYTNPLHQAKLPIVVNAHFTLDIRRLVPVEDHSGDLAYTLRAIPNYHPALYAISIYDRQKKLNLKRSYTADCFLRRAIYFQPKDSTSYMLFAMHLQETQRLKLAQQYYEKGLEISPKAAELNYNYGLFMLSQGKMKQAKKAAEMAYNRGYPLQGLKNKLLVQQKK